MLNTALAMLVLNANKADRQKTFEEKDAKDTFNAFAETLKVCFWVLFMVAYSKLYFDFLSAAALVTQ